MKIVRKISLLTTLMIAFAAFAAESHADEAVADSELAIRNEILLFSGPEVEMSKATDKLKLRPRQKVLEILKSDLKVMPRIPPSSLRAISALNGFELLPDLKKVALTTEDWTVFVLLNELLQSKHETDLKIAANEESDLIEIYKKRITTSAPTMVKIVVLDGLSLLKVPIGDVEFADFLAAKDFQLRIAAVRNLAGGVNQLNTKQKLARYREALKAKPYQARLVAILSYASMSEADKKSLFSALPSKFCQSETQAEILEACKKVSTIGRGK